MRREFITVAAGEPLLEVQRTMRLARLRHVLVVEGATLVGILSYRDVQEAALEQAGLRGDRWSEGLRAVTRALDRGVTLFDTSDSYGLGRAERLLIFGFGVGLSDWPGWETLEATLWILAIGTWVTVLQRFYRTWAQLKV